MIAFPTPAIFQWDAGNHDKNWSKHRVTNQECEETFFDNRKKIFKDQLHSGTESRFMLVGRTKQHRIFFIVFTIRKKNIRVISARDMNKKEQQFYEKAIKTPGI